MHNLQELARKRRIRREKQGIQNLVELLQTVTTSFK